VGSVLTKAVFTTYGPVAPTGAATHVASPTAADVTATPVQLPVLLYAVR
jgi:hypothetical protein